MFALGICYLNGWSMAAADGAKKEQPEWPPHPDRVFMALAAAWFETGEDSKEGEALRWLEAQPPPAIAATGYESRVNVTSYVPVNDVKGGLHLLPKHRPRQPRGFPVAIPHDPTVRLIWRETELGAHRDALERLAAKITHIGHSASFVQAWVEEDGNIATDLEPAEGITNLEPAEGITRHRLRIPSTGRLDGLIRACNRTAFASWIDYQDLRGEIDRAEAKFKKMMQPPRTPWDTFPDAVLLADESSVKQHPLYPDAKAGDGEVATVLVDDLVDETGVVAVQALIDKISGGGKPMLVSAHAYEREGINAIPAALTSLLNERTGLPFDTAVVQTNVVSHTGADGYGRLARQACFEGDVKKGQEYVMVDDFIGQGGTLANLRGWVEKKGGKILGAIALTGKIYSARLNPSQEQLHELRQRHGQDFEKWWKDYFGHTFDCLTQSEARYLARSPDVDTIRDRLASEKQRGNHSACGRSPREQKKYIRELKARLKNQFPDGQPVKPTSMYPTSGKWQGYRSQKITSMETPDSEVRGSIFDPRIIVLSIKGKRISLPTTLTLTVALRGLLMKECPEQPPPEWFCGHRSNGTPTAAPHLALAPFPFVGSEHADGRIMGVALILPVELNPQEAGKCLGPFLHESSTGLPREHRLFDGQWFECRVELETREQPPRNLDPNIWTRESCVWASVTPVVLNRHFGGKDKWERVAESVKDACGHINLPRPREVLLHPVSLVEGVPHAREYPQLTRKSDGGRLSHSHVVIVFDKPVRGPVLVGAGRFRGYGLCRPMDERGSDRD